MDKAELRKIFKAKRTSLSKDESTSRSKEINENFLQNLLPKIYQIKSNPHTPLTYETKIVAKHNASHLGFPYHEEIEDKNNNIFSLYRAANNEVSTQEIEDFFIKNNIKFSYPKIIAKDQPLNFIAHHQQTNFSGSNFYTNILEPDFGEEVLPDFLLIPLVAFDRNLSRLGMGGGFFDRTIDFLKKRKSQITTIGLAYDFQESKNLLPIENTDCALDFIVTEEKLFSAKPIPSSFADIKI